MEYECAEGEGKNNTVYEGKQTKCVEEANKV